MKIRTHIIAFTLLLAGSVAFGFGGGGEFGKLKLAFQKLKWSILPKSTESITLGSASKKFKEAHIKDLYVEHVAGDTIVETVTGGINITNSGSSKNSILDLDDSITVDTIVERTVGAGVNIEKVPIQDGNVDGRDVSVDGTKLDTVEEGATADQTGGEIEDLLAALTGENRLSSDSLKEGSTNLFMTSTQESHFEAAYNDSHVQGTDQKLDEGGGNEVAAAELRLHVDNLSKHREIDDNAIGNTDLWSGDKITSELSGKQATGDYLEDGDFGSNGLMKRTGAGAYSIITDNSTYWGQMSDKVASDSPNWDAAYTLKGVLDALNGIMKCDGAGNYSIITDLSTYWTQMSDEVASDSPNWDDAYNRRVVTWTSPLAFSLNTASMPAATNASAGHASAAHVQAIEANTAKNTNVPTALSVGTVGENTVAITSDGGADDVTLPAATNSTAGMMTKAKFDEVVANTAKANSLTRYLYWSPAYNGYALSADGSNNDAGDSGIIVAFAGTLGDGAKEDTPYIEWASTTAGVNDYDVIVCIPIPADYSSMGSVSVEYMSDTVLEDTATVSLYDSDDVADSSVALSSSTWAVDETMSPSGTYTAGERMTIKLHLECAQNQKIRVGEIRCSYVATR